MELIAILRVLWARRITVGVGIIAAVAAGVLVGHKVGAAGATSGGAVGSIAVVLDTRDSQLVHGAPDGASTLSTRAFLLADVLAADSAARQIARDARVPPRQLEVLTPAAQALPQVDSPLVGPTYQMASLAAAPYVVEPFADRMTPIIRLVTQAPDARRAALLARAAAATLHSLFLREDGAGEHGFVLDTVSPLRTKQLPPPSSHAPILMIAAALATFVFWCVGLVFAVALGRRLRPRPGGLPA